MCNNNFSLYIYTFCKADVCSNVLTFDLQLAHKYDPQKEEELRMWINEVTGHKLPENFMEGLKDGVILCE